jgi:tRNA nucleotidyltransferase (CCA-adding enzyme)
MGKAGTVPKAVQSPFSLPNPELLERLGAVAHRLRTRSFLVGGPVRDLVLAAAEVRCQKLDVRSQKPPASTPGSACLPDVDIAVEDRSREFGNAVAKALGGSFVYHARFLTGTVHLTLPPDPRTLAPDHIDITQARTETYSKPAVLPKVKPARIEDDLARRDFTINAIALELTPAAFGRMLDPHDGRADIARRSVRVLHDRSFIDDPTRIFRAIRFATRLGFAIDEHTLELMRRAVADKLPALLTPERVLYELRLVCAEPLVLQMTEALVHERVLEAAWGWTPSDRFLPDLALMVQRRATPDLLFTYLLNTLPVTDRFPIRKEEREAAAWISGFGKVRPLLLKAAKPSAVVKLLRDAPVPALGVLALIEPAEVASVIRLHLERFSQVKVSVTGADLRALGVRPGPRYREILDRLLSDKLDGRIRTMADERRVCERLCRREGK